MEKTIKSLEVGENGIKPKTQQLHPLLFPPVLNRVFNYLPFFHHKKCRLVCKTWDAELHSFIRCNSKVNLTNLVAEEGRINFLELITGINKLCTSYLIEDPQIIPTLQQSLPFLLIKHLEVKNIKWNIFQVKHCLLKVLPHLEELRLPVSCSSDDLQMQNHKTPTNKYITKSKSITNWNNAEEKSNSPSFYEETFPKLKSLIITLTIKDLQFFDYKLALPHPILNLIQSAPNLEEFYYPNIVQFTSPYNNPARMLLENIISTNVIAEHNFLNRLSTLKIDTFISNTDLRTLTARKFPLKILQLTVTPNICCRHLYDFLTCSSSTLKTLTLTFRDGFKLTSTFPKLSGLEKMAIILWNGSLDFVEEIVQMKILIVVLIEVEEDAILTQFTSKNFSEQSNIEVLEIHANKPGKEELVKKIVKMMPQKKLRKLSVDRANDSFLRNVYASLPNIQELVVLYGGFSCSGVTGIPPTFCREEYCQNEGYGLELKRRMGVADLKYLKSLVLTGDLTDFLVILGICQCNLLQRLELTARGTSKVTDKSIMKIADVLSLQLEFIKLKNFRGLANISDRAWEYLEAKFKGREIHVC